ncbi:MAG TPA: hypothetical protein VN238_10115 [Solirubrobacteraceae bacterium]|nr:hypothetical protein [Solirubrobacteraceae bacterium]
MAALVALALATAGTAIGAAPASAFTNVSGGPVNFTTTNFTVGTAFRCNAGAMSGVAAPDNGPGAGGTVRIGGPASLTSCTAYGGPATATLEASWAYTYAAFPASGTTTLGGFFVKFTFGPALSCLYEGSVSGTYGPTGQLPIASSTFTLLQAVGPACPASPSASGSFLVKNSLGNPVVV